MALKSHETIIDDIQDMLGSNTTDFTDALLTKSIERSLHELSQYCPHVVRETFALTEDSKEIDISEIKDLLWIDAIEFKTGKTIRQWRNWAAHYGDEISMAIDFWPADEDSGIDTDEALDSGEEAIDCDADATTAIPVGTIIRIESELYYVTATGTTLTVESAYGRSSNAAHATNKDIMIPELAYLYCAKTHKVPVVADLAGAATAAYTAGVLTINVDGLSATGTIEAGTTFTITGDATTTHYTLLKDTVLATNAGDVTFTPALAEAIIEDAVVTFDNSTLTPELETLLIELVASRAALSVSKKFVQGIPKSGRNPFADYRKAALEDYGIVLGKLEDKAKRSHKPLLSRFEG